MKHTNLYEILDKVITIDGLSQYHHKLIEVLGLVADTGDWELDDEIVVPTYNETSKKWENVSTTISGAISQLYMLINSLELKPDTYKDEDFTYDGVIE